ncbi:MAG: helix-turn-helix domain-containing protein [Chloroflexota bacterium]
MATTVALASVVGRLLAHARRAIGLSQEEVSRRSGVSQSKVSRLERGVRSGVGLDDLEQIARSLGGRLNVDLVVPFLGDRRRQRDRAHARCVSFVARRLERAGWIVRTEVEIHGSWGPGWIDVLAWHPGSNTLLVKRDGFVHVIAKEAGLRRRWPA